MARRSSADWDRLERAVHRALNRARSSHGLPRLRPSRPISSAAALHSADLARHGSLSHTSSDGTTFDRRIRRYTRARVVGEVVIAYHGRLTGRRVVRAWLESPGHRAQVLGSRYRRAGVGRATRRGRTVITVDFASRR